MTKIKVELASLETLDAVIKKYVVDRAATILAMTESQDIYTIIFGWHDGK